MTAPMTCICGASFLPRTPWQRFCSSPCRKVGTEQDRKAKDSARQKRKYAAKRRVRSIRPETARLVPGRDDLAVESDGTAWSCIPSRVARYAGRWAKLTPFLKDGCAFVSIMRGGSPRRFVLAKLVLSTWVEPRPLGHSPLHFPDADPLNNRAENLRWVPRGALYLESNVNSRPPRNRPGVEANNARLDRATIAKILRMRRSGEYTMAEIADRFGVGETTVHSLLTGRSYREETENARPIPSPRTNMEHDR